MRKLLAWFLLCNAISLAQSPFDGTWVLDTGTTQFPEKPAVYSLVKGVFLWEGIEIKADGSDQRVPVTGYWDTVSVRAIDAYTVEIISKKAGKVMFTEVDTVSLDGRTLTQVVKDTTEGEAVTIETVSQRVEPGPAGSHALSGSWKAYKTGRSENGSTITYRCTANGFSGETPLGEKFDAKFDGKDYPVRDDRAHSTVSVRLLNPNTIEQTGKRDGKIVGILHLTVSPDGRSIHATYENKETNATTSYVMRRKP